jgi:hypothetical protein
MITEMEKRRKTYHIKTNAKRQSQTKENNVRIHLNIQLLDLL